MASLTKDLRRQLERTVAEARKISEEGAEQSLRRLAVDVSRPHDALTAEEKRFRVSLRVHAKQLGDRLDERPTRLIQAVAYEHWHRLLFTRFLIENDLLLHPEHEVALSLDEVKELALGESREWVEVAADYAQRMLLRCVFQPEDPALSVSLPPEKRLQLEAKLNALSREVFLADDSLGWVYQFWQRDEKERVNKSEVKIGADEVAPVTQLFTEDYMVLFLLENTLGAWWMGRHGNAELPGYTWTYLRLIDDGTPAAGTFDGWPKKAKDLRVLDPCMGSGHFLIFALPILVRMRMEEEGIPIREAVTGVLRDNIFGLELDSRCAQIAAFNLALTAWKLAGEHFHLPELNLACSGLGINTSESDWLRLAGDNQRARQALQKLYSLLFLAPTLGSLIDPNRQGGELFASDFDEIKPLLEKALLAEQSKSSDTKELVVAAQGLLSAARLLSSKFTLVVTNPPYLVKSKQGPVLREFCGKTATDASADLATVFLDRFSSLCDRGGTHATVTPQNWLFLKGYSAFRKKLLQQYKIQHVTTVGSGATATASWDVVRALAIISNSHPGPEYTITGVETDAAQDEHRGRDIRTKEVLTTKSSTILGQPNCRIAVSAGTGGRLLGTFADCLQGLATGDKPRFQGCFWEFVDIKKTWAFQLGPVARTTLYSGSEKVIRWEDGKGELARSEGARIQGLQALGRRGVAVTQMRNLPVCVSVGSFFDNNIAVVLPKDDDDFLSIWAYCSSDAFPIDVRRIDKKLSVTNATLGHVPFDSAHWRERAQREYPNGLPHPYSSDPTQWFFGGHPKSSDHPLQVAVARLVGYQWPRQTGSSFSDCPAINPDGLESYADTDGIVCLSPLAGEESAADRFRSLLRAAYGEEYSLAELLKGKRSATLDDWLRDEFFEEHCRVFDQRPFTWHVWDGRRDGFHALVNYHRLNRKTLEKLIYSSLGDWINRQRQDLAAELEGADGRLAAAEHLQAELKKILDGEKPYDVFVRWKSVKQQPVGWEPDLNDGVCVNIRPWIMEARLYRATKAGILRVTPNIKYGKDRGKEPARDPKEFPWFKDSTERNNDIHLTLEEKRRARGLA
jgi:hypothetical protein